MKIDITPNTPEADLRRLVARSYVQQAWMCFVAAAMAMLAYTMLGDGITIGSAVTSFFCALAMYYSARAFHSTAMMRASLRNLIKMQRLMKS